MTRRQLLATTGAAAGLAGVLRGGESGGNALRVRAFDPSGAPASDDLLSTTLLTRPDSRPFEVLAQPAGGGLAAITMPAEKFELKMMLPVRDFGTVYLHADNGGAGYSPSQARPGEVLLNYEFARSRAAFVGRYLESAQAEGVTFSPGMMQRLERGEAALARAAAARETGARLGHSNDSLADTMWAGEMAALERARHRIVRQEQRRGFLFGSNADGYAQSEEYARHFRGLFNYATVGFFRAGTERVEGRPEYPRVDAILTRTAGTDLLIKGHPLVWFHRAGIPEFLKTKSWPELKSSCRDYILRSVARFRDRIHSWDVINEAHNWANELNLDGDQLLEITRLAAESTRFADPMAFRVINCCLPWGEYVATGRTYAGPIKRPARTPLDYYRSLADVNVPYEAVGVQVYYPGYDLLEIERQLERFFPIGKPMHITELGVPSSSEGVKGGAIPYDRVWHGTEWSEPVQADWVEQFYTLCYSKPEIQAISWWNFVDTPRAGFRGMLDSGFQPKQSYRRLAALLEDWRA